MNCTLRWVFWEARRHNQLSLDAIQSLACGSSFAPLSKSLLRNLMMLKGEKHRERSESFILSNSITFLYLAQIEVIWILMCGLLK